MPIESARVDFFAEQLRRVPEESRRAVRAAIVDATRGVRADAARRASWSSRIPGAITMRVSFTTARVEIRVNARRAPHARPYEGISGRTTFRHPVYGNRNVWVEQAARPFLRPAVDGRITEIRDAVERAVYRSLPG